MPRKGRGCVGVSPDIYRLTARDKIASSSSNERAKGESASKRDRSFRSDHYSAESTPVLSHYRAREATLLYLTASLQLSMTSPPLASASTVRCTSLGLFILDKFEYRSQAVEGSTLLAPPTYQLGGGGTYAILGARMWLPAHEVALVVDRGTDWQMDVQKQLDSFGQMWYWREKDGLTTTALNLYTGEHRGRPFSPV